MMARDLVTYGTLLHRQFGADLAGAETNTFAAAYRETYEWLYGDPEGVKTYAEYGQVSVHLAMRIRDEFLPKAALLPDRISGIESLTRDAIDFKVYAGTTVRRAACRAHPDPTAG